MSKAEEYAKIAREIAERETKRAIEKYVEGVKKNIADYENPPDLDDFCFFIELYEWGFE